MSTCRNPHPLPTAEREQRLLSAARPPKGGTTNGAFTVMEFVIVTGLMVLAVGAMLVLSDGLGKSILSITSQLGHNQTAGNGIEMMIQRIQLANFASNDASGNSLTLSFDDDPDVDSNADKITWNDQDHFEQFQYVSSGENSFIGYTTNVNTAWTNVVVPGSVRKLSGQPIFSISNRTVWINFGLLTTNRTPFSQAIEIRTKAALRNKLN